MLKTEIEARSKIETVLDSKAKGWKYAGGNRGQDVNHAAYSLSLIYVVPIIESFDSIASDFESMKLNSEMDISFISSNTGLIHGLMESEILTFQIKLN